MKKGTYDKIEEVMGRAGRPLCDFEFKMIYIASPRPKDASGVVDGLTYIGCSEATLGRRLRELRSQGRTTSQRRQGKAFVEYSLISTTANFSEEPLCRI